MDRADGAIAPCTENLIGSPNGKFVSDEVFPWAFADAVETDEAGYFSPKAPTGKIQLDAQWSEKYYADPMEVDFKQDQQTIKDFVVKPLPTITGRVTNSAGEAVVRVLSLGEPPGVDGYPSYLLVAPEGNIVANDRVAGDDNSNGALFLRLDKLELIYSHLRRAAQK